MQNFEQLSSRAFEILKLFDKSKVSNKTGSVEEFMFSTIVVFVVVVFIVVVLVVLDADVLLVVVEIVVVSRVEFFSSIEIIFGGSFQSSQLFRNSPLNWKLPTDSFP